MLIVQRAKQDEFNCVPGHREHWKECPKQRSYQPPWYSEEIREEWQRGRDTPLNLHCKIQNQHNTIINYRRREGGRRRVGGTRARGGDWATGGREGEGWKGREGGRGREGWRVKGKEGGQGKEKGREGLREGETEGKWGRGSCWAMGSKTLSQLSNLVAGLQLLVLMI